MENLLYSISQVLGITIIHSLWQGLLVYVILCVLFVSIPYLTASKKYNLGSIALLSMAVWFVYTFCTEALAYNWGPVIPVSSAPLAGGLNFSTQQALPGKEYLLPVTHQSIEVYKTSLQQTVKDYLPYISFIYLAGLIINLGRLSMAWNNIRIIKHGMTAAAKLQQRIDKFSKQLNIRKHVQVMFSELVDVPCVIGYIKPVLLLPVTITTQLSAAEIEAILLHELAHIKGNDYLVNLIQQIIKVLLFFNPFAHLVSRIMSTERENRCDDRVIQITGNPLTYAHALLKLEETRQTYLKLALAATGNKYHLLGRIERMMKTKKPITNIRPVLLTTILLTGSVAIGLSFTTVSKTTFTLSGKITGNPNAWVDLHYTNAQGKDIHDDYPLKNGTFNFKGDISTPHMVWLTVYTGYLKKIIEDSDPNKAAFFLEPGNITITGSYGHLKDIKVNGSKTQDEYLLYGKRFAAFNKIYDPLEAKYIAVNHELINAKKNNLIGKVIDSLNNILYATNAKIQKSRSSYVKINRQYITTHPNSYVSAFMMQFYTEMSPPDTAKVIFNKLSPDVQNSDYGKNIQNEITRMDNNSAGKPAKDFTATDANGKTINLSDFKGRYVLLDFWASYVPELESAPHLIQLYKKYNKAGLDVIGVADDDAHPDDWKKGIKRNGTGIWYNVLRGLKETKDGFDTSNSIDDKFDAASLPTKILIDKNGNIAGRYVGTEQVAALDKKLAETFKN